jgi:UDP-N-acetylglucosamine--N-acetylmuramyl-(pentapeptide) pyrophosphoryl-undecaprenol N-acetylglucosamine transferase
MDDARYGSDRPDRSGRPDRTSPRPRHALLAGGGTGGHVFPALAVAEELGRRGWTVSATGLAAGIEARLAGERGIPFHPLPARPLVGRGVAAKAGALATVLRGSAAANGLVRRLKVDAVLGTGGYVSAPAVLGARLARRPVLLLEPNARAGVANRWLSRWATAAAVAFRDTVGDLKCPCIVTGVPVRREFFAVPPALPPLDPPRLLVLGGSQGAQQINRALPPAVARLAGRLPGLRVLHQAGPRHVEETRELYAAAGVAAGTAEVVPFLEDVAGAMAASHLLVSRAGAITVAEICAAGRPAVLWPLAIAQGHQRDNARLLAEAGGAEVIEQAEIDPERLAQILGGLLGDGSRLARMAAAVRGLARPGAAAAIADRLEEMVG